MVSKKELYRQLRNLERRIRYLSNTICAEGHKWYIVHEDDYRTCTRCGLIIIDDDAPDLL